MASNGYERAPRSTVNRLKARGKYDYATIHTIIDTAPILHVSFNSPDPDDPFPTILPMLGCTAPPESTEPSASNGSSTAPGTFPEEDAPPPSNEPRHIYLHGYVSSRLMKLPSDTSPGVPLCISAAHLDGIVLALAPFHNSCNYRSAVIHGYATAVTSESERLSAMQLITDNTAHYRWDNSRNPPTNAELTSTGILRVEIVSASAKVRVGGPSDDRPDLRNEELVGRTWTGVVPTWMQYGEPVASGYNKVVKVPGYLREWVREENEKNKKQALEALQK